MKYCNRCGAPMEDGAYNCPACGVAQGAPVQAETSTLGVLAIVFSVFGGWLGLVLAIIGLCTYKLEENRKKCKIALGIVITEVILGIVIAIIFFVAVATQVPDAPNMIFNLLG